ncbi:uncharacterized protein SOCG_02783 [Schizosaccharomyces octosporus yFS286]|uniref:Uncharacterized protein n=1 Tax=Schizosaccharomyces octosporus (strain yFS286) TaxID=483514 RepID=S9Q032_SCHOY|nr:uncharacterized protein SOCG_02783 [Schizosaccharomyces octosporus yFS286]EPX73562.1 hypothetical protein SOCG_02783 [Schizosaccharomyces octosporus yFS286]
MKNKYSPVPDSDESFNTLIDEKSDIHSSEGTPPPYSAPNKFIDLEMADGSAQHSAQESTNNIGSDSTYSKWVPLRAETLWGLSAACGASVVVFLYSMSQIPKEWFKQTGRVLSNMCAAALYVCFLNVPGFAMYYTAKKIMQFEKINNLFLYAVCFIDFVLFVFISMNPIARERFRLLVINIGNGIGNGVNGIGNGIIGIGNGIGNSVNLAFGPNQGDEVSQNEEIELQHLAEQSVNPIARERFRLLVINIGNGIGNGVNGIGNGIIGIGNGIGNSVNLAFGPNQGDEVSQNEEIELQHLAEQSGEV